MTHARRQALMTVLKVYDLILMAVVLALSPLPAIVRHHSITLEQFLAMRVRIQNFFLLFVLLAVWHIILVASGLYQSHRLSKLRDDAMDVLKATSFATLSAFLLGGVLHIRMTTPQVMTWFWFGSSIGLILSRIALRSILRSLRLHSRNLRNMLIVGTNARAIEFAHKIRTKPHLGYRIVGFADDNWDGLKRFNRSGYPLACELQGLPSYLRKNPVDEVVLALPIRSFYFEASRIAELCEEQGIINRVLSSLFDLKLARSRTEEFEGEFLITHYTGGIEGWPAIAKRVFDFWASLALLLLLSPVLAVAALLIKLTSPGPVFFKQKRLGLNKREFLIYKFRTMIPDAEKKQREIEHMNEVSGPVFKIKNDPRITPVGRFLRKTSIDELPQLINVLKGDMSLVGPRPLPLRDYVGFDKDWQRRRFSIRPGITCLWQVNGRSSIGFEQWMELDMQYIDKWSLWLDMRILLKTIPAVLRGSGAA